MKDFMMGVGVVLIFLGVREMVLAYVRRKAEAGVKK